MTAWLAHRLGRRGTFLLLFGIVYAIFGWSLLTTDTTPERALVFGWLPDQARAAIWFTAAAFALVFAWRRSPGDDTPGFLALIVPPIIRGVSFLWALLVWYVTDGEIGYPDGWAGAAIWVAVVGVVLLIASWAEPTGFVPSQDDGGDTHPEDD